MTDRRTNSWLPWAVFWTGLGLLTFGYGMDWLGIGYPGIGPSQLALMGSGLALTVFALALALLQRVGWIRLPDPSLPKEDAADLSDVALLSVFLGLLAGIADPALQYGLNAVGLRFLYINIHMWWMSPISYSAFFLALFSLISLTVRAGSGLARWRWLASVRGLAAIGLAALLLSLLYKLHPELHIFASLLLSVGVGVQTFRLLRGRSGHLSRPLVTTSAFALVVVVALTGWKVAWPAMAEGWRTSQLSAADADAPDVLLIILDTVRQLNTSMAGYVRNTTPRLATRAQRGVVFEHAISTSPWSAPSHASLVTGAYPVDLNIDWLSPLEEGHVTLAETLQLRGYRTGGFFANKIFGGRHTRLDRGMLHWDVDQVSWLALVGASTPGLWILEPRRLDPPLHNHNQRTVKDASTVIDEFLEWRRRDEGRPYFAMLNLFDAHSPYEPPDAYRGLFGDEDRPDHPNRSPVSSDVLHRHLDGYDALISYLDDELDRLFSTLDEEGSLDRTLVIVTSDHGEAFGETGQVEHGNAIGFPVVNVPLVMFMRDRIPEGLRIRTPVTIRDIPATVLELAGPAADHALPGRTLSRFWNGGETPIAGDPVLSMVTDRSWIVADGQRHSGNILAAFDSTLQYLRYGTEGAEELYDFTTDPWGEKDLSTDARSASALLRFRQATDSVAAVFMARRPSG